MVQKYQSPVRVYKYPFELVMAAYERRFPTCPMIPIFVSSDIVVDQKAEDGSQHLIERRCKLNVDAPYLLKKIAGVDFVYFIQKNTLDLKARALKIEAYNESFATRVIINEVCNYFVHPENPEWTCFDQSASLEIKSFFGCEHLVEKLAIKQYSANIAKGKEIIEFFIDQLKQEGITYVAPWEDKSTPAAVDGSGDAPEISNCRKEEVDNDDDDDDDNDDDDFKEPRALSTAMEDLQLGASASSLKSQHSHLSRQRSGSGDKGLIPLIRCDSFSEEDDKFRLDADYIQRYLGELSLLEESQLIQLRTWLHHLQRGNLPSDAMLLRFLRAGDFNIEKARELISQSLTWRKKYQVDKILSEYEMPQVVRDLFPGGWHFNDKDGRPLYILRLGMMDVKGLIKSIGEEGLLRLTLHVCEEGLRLTEEATIQSGHAVTTWALLLDLEGLNMRHLWRPGIKVLLRIIEIVEANYPETMGRVLIIRAPRVFPVLWTLVRTFIDERTCSKFFFYGGNDYQGPGGLPDYIPEEYIPDFLGGTCKAKISDGGLVPKSSYMSEELYESLTLSDESIYRSVSLSKGQIHEVVLHNEDLGSVITWDFDVLRHSVSFSVFCTKNPITSAPPTPNGPLGGQTIQAESDHKTVIEKSWKEGQDYFRIEPPFICHDGESVQGSHVTNQVGYFILQWKYHDGSYSSIPHLHDSVSSSKSKVMYYYEVLKSADYRGSMTSLQSHQSGFSSLSSKSILSASNNSGVSGAISSCPSR
ncbi:unnamed protein product [Allacma fusca]|uniref:SEC14-like protein 1 n=1 Tax=Allacma fusca TaxID=39272 RepID=A0A8J2J301_9HEXA|nr:unnamed protein product [Allacma fusca]